MPQIKENHNAKKLAELEKRKAKAYEMYSDGKFHAEIYRETGITKNVLDRYIKKNDLPSECPEYYEIMMDFVCALYLKGEYSLVQIEREFGIWAKDVRTHMKGKSEIMGI